LAKYENKIPILIRHSSSLKQLFDELVMSNTRKSEVDPNNVRETQSYIWFFRRYIDYLVFIAEYLSKKALDCNVKFATDYVSYSLNEGAQELAAHFHRYKLTVPFSVLCNVVLDTKKYIIVVDDANKLSESFPLVIKHGDDERQGNALTAIDMSARRQYVRVYADTSFSDTIIKIMTRNNRYLTFAGSTFPCYTPLSPLLCTSVREFIAKFIIVVDDNCISMHLVAYMLQGRPKYTEQFFSELLNELKSMKSTEKVEADLIIKGFVKSTQYTLNKYITNYVYLQCTKQGIDYKLNSTTRCFKQFS